MSVRGNLAVNQLLELLEARYAIRVLWALRDGYPQTFRLLQDSVGRITPNTLNTRLKELRAAGLLTHTETGYSLTDSGMDLTRRLSDLHAFATRWVAAQEAGGAAKGGKGKAAARAPVKTPARRKPKATLQIDDARTGRGAVARSGRRVSVHYTGWLYENGRKGTQFASSHDHGEPYVFTLGAGEVIRGWEEGVLGMKVGCRRTLIIPPDMGYGARGATGIPPGATLLFEVELLGVQR